MWEDVIKRHRQVNSDLAKNKYFVNESMRPVDHKFYKNPVFMVNLTLLDKLPYIKLL